MEFGFTLKPEHTIERTIALTRQAEAAGLRLRLALRLARPVARSVSAADAHGRRDRAAAPRDLRHEPGHPRALGHRVLARGPRRAERRPDGPGHRPRRLARRVLGKPPTTMATLEEAIGVIRDLVEGRSVDLRGHRARACPGRGNWTLPVWVAGYGPMALAMTGRVADGVILQLADPGPDPLVRRPGARGARPPPAATGGDPSRSRPPRRAHVGDRARLAASGRAGSRRSSATTSSTSSTSTRASSCRSR